MGNLTLEKTFKSTVKYTYNELNQLTSRNDAEGTTRYTYDARGNRVRDKLANWLYSRCVDYTYDATNHLVSGTPSSTVTSAYTWNGLGMRVNNTQTDQKKAVLDRDYVIDYTSVEHNDLAVFANGYYEHGLYSDALYEQKNLYANGSFIEQYYHQFNNQNGNGEKWALHYVHEDIRGSVVRYSAENPAYSDPYYDASFYKEFNYEEHVYDDWGAVQESRGYLNDGKTTVVEPNFTGHTYDSVLELYFADARFYDANNRQWMSVDPVKSGLNWYQYCYSNPQKYFDPDGEHPIIVGAIIGGIVGGVGTLVEGAVRANDPSDVLANALANASIGALAGAMIGSGAGAVAGFQIVGSAIAGGTVGALTGGGIMNGASGAAITAMFDQFLPGSAFIGAFVGEIHSEYWDAQYSGEVDKRRILLNAGLASAISLVGTIPGLYYDQAGQIWAGAVTDIAGNTMGKFYAGISEGIGVVFESLYNMVGNQTMNYVSDRILASCSYNTALTGS